MIKRKMFLSFHSVIIYVWETYNDSGSTDALCYKKQQQQLYFRNGWATVISPNNYF